MNGKMIVDSTTCIASRKHHLTCTASYGQVTPYSGDKGDDSPGQSLGLIIQVNHVGLGQLDHRHVTKELRGDEDKGRDTHDGAEALERLSSGN
jgi:hypothetical protein